jgi:hypothetical protein
MLPVLPFEEEDSEEEKPGVLGLLLLLPAPVLPAPVLAPLMWLPQFELGGRTSPKPGEGHRRDSSEHALAGGG